MKRHTRLAAGFALLTLGLSTSCEDMMETTSSLVMFSDDHYLDQPTDTVYSVLGILNKMQALADKTVLLGEIRADLVSLTAEAPLDLKKLAAFQADANNTYNSPHDYYAVINNCNYYLSHVDTTLKKRNEPIFQKEYAAVKAFRAWTYLQLVTTYGEVPFITEPILTESAANKVYPMYTIKAVCDYFIDDLTPYVNVELPAYGPVSGLDSKKFFLPVRVVLGDLCLWGERYREAAGYYRDYLANETAPVTTGLNQASWRSSESTFALWDNNFAVLFNNMGNQEIVSYIPMENSERDKDYSQLRNLFNSTSSNNYYVKATPSARMLEISRTQSHAFVYTNGALRDTLYAPARNDEHPLWVGDLRLAATYTVVNTNETPDYNSLYAPKKQTIAKFATDHVVLYRRGQIYLRYAEALNRAGLPQAAFAVLKYGLYANTLNLFVSSEEKALAGNLLNFSQYTFTATNTLGIHSRGSGNAGADTSYIIPVLASKEDSIRYVEDLICTENALETAFEGYRFYDLLRMALRRNDSDFLASRIAVRQGTAGYDAALYSNLLDRSKWFLPLP